MDMGNSKGVNNEFMVKWVRELVKGSCIFRSTPFNVLMHIVYENITYAAFFPSLLHKAGISFVHYLSKRVLIHLDNTAIFHSIVAHFEWKTSSSHQKKKKSFTTTV